MKVIQVISHFGLAGAQTMCENLIYALSDAGCQVVAVSIQDRHSPITERLEQRGTDLRYLGKGPGVDLSMIKKLRDIFRRERPDVVHTHVNAIQYAIPAARLAGVPVMVHTVHSVAKNEQVLINRIASAFFFRRWGVVPVALSGEVRETVKKEYALEDAEVPVIFNGTDLSRCRVKESYDSGETFSILHIGRFADPKNHSGLVRAFGLFRQTHPASELTLVGEGPLLEPTRELVRQLGLTDCVRFAGTLGDVSSALHEADLFALPSNYEGMPMTLIEAMGTGLPIVATAVGGIPDMLSDGVEAYVVKNDTQQIAAAFSDAAEHPERRAALGRAARLRAERYSARVMGESYLRLYERLLRRPNR